jgi:hypothetical protein
LFTHSWPWPTGQSSVVTQVRIHCPALHVWPRGQSELDPQVQKPPLHVFPNSRHWVLLVHGIRGGGTDVRHVSPVVQAKPSSQEAPGVAVWMQPIAGSQESVVHGLPSSQLMPTDSHWPVLGLHVSSVQRLLSGVQVTEGVPMQEPF